MVVHLKIHQISMWALDMFNVYQFMKYSETFAISMKVLE